MDYPTFQSKLFNKDFVVVVQSLSRVRLFATPWTTAGQASPSFTISRSLLRLMSIELVRRAWVPPFLSTKAHRWCGLPAFLCPGRAWFSLTHTWEPGASAVFSTLVLPAARHVHWSFCLVWPRPGWCIFHSLRWLLTQTENVTGELARWWFMCVTGGLPAVPICVLSSLLFSDVRFCPIDCNLGLPECQGCIWGCEWERPLLLHTHPSVHPLRPNQTKTKDKGCKERGPHPTFKSYKMLK